MHHSTHTHTFQSNLPPLQNEIFRLKATVAEQGSRLTALEGVEADNASLRDKVAGLRGNLLTTQRALEELPKVKARCVQLEEENAALLVTQQAQVGVRSIKPLPHLAPPCPTSWGTLGLIDGGVIW